jgi:hypothetical protein
VKVGVELGGRSAWRNRWGRVLSSDHTLDRWGNTSGEKRYPGAILTVVISLMDLFPCEDTCSCSCIKLFVAVDEKLMELTGVVSGSLVHLFPMTPCLTIRIEDAGAILSGDGNVGSPCLFAWRAAFCWVLKVTLQPVVAATGQGSREGAFDEGLV